MILMKMHTHGSLAELIHRQGNCKTLIPDSLYNSVFIARLLNGISNGLTVMHGHGIVHNDLKVCKTSLFLPMYVYPRYSNDISSRLIS
jgi:hypothetical protein